MALFIAGVLVGLGLGLVLCWFVIIRALGL